MDLTKRTLRGTDWLKHHVQRSDNPGIDPPQESRSTNQFPNTRQESPGRSKNTPIIVPGEETSPLIVVESRDISPVARKSESFVELESPRSEDYESPRGDKNRKHFYGIRSRTLSPQPRSGRSHEKSKSDNILGAALEAIASLKGASHVAKTESKESAVQSDAVTTPHANRKYSPTEYGNRTMNTTLSRGNISRDSDRQDNDVPNVASMTSSITSIDSEEDHLDKQQYLPSTLRQQASLTKQTNPQSLKSKNLIQQPSEQNGMYRQSKTILTTERREIHSTISRGKRHAKPDVGIVDKNLSTPIKPSATTPDIIYDALNDGSTSCSQLGNGMSPLPYSLSDVLRGSSSDNASFFHDFRNPIIAPSPKQSPLRISNVDDAPSKQDVKDKNGDYRSSKTPEELCTEKTRMRDYDKNMARHHVPIRSVLDNDVDEVESSYSNKDDVSNHSILQLCTEDLMSDDAERVNAALERLHDVCCFVTNKNTSRPMKTTSSVVSTSSTSSSALNRIRFIKSGGHALIVGVMKKFTSTANIQAAACKLIRQLILMDEYNVQSSSNSTNEHSTSNRNGNSGAFNELFSAVYGMDCVINALQRFRPTQSTDDALHNDVYNLACGALVAIVCSSFKMVDRLLQHDTRNISIFLKAIHAPINKKSPGVNRVIYYVLKQFPQFVNEIVLAGGIEEVINEMKHFPDSIEVQYCGCAAIGSLLKKNSRMIMSTLSPQDAKRYGEQSVADYIVNHLHGANVIVAALKAFPCNEDIQGKGVIALCNITVSAAATKANLSITSSIKKAGGLSAIGIALENFPGNHTIQDNGCLAIKSLLESSIVTPTTK